MVFIVNIALLYIYVFKEDKMILNTSLDFWQQPKNLDFNTKNSQFGMGIKSELGMRLSSWDSNSKSTYYFDDFTRLWLT